MIKFGNTSIDFIIGQGISYFFAFLVELFAKNHRNLELPFWKQYPQKDISILI